MANFTRQVTDIAYMADTAPISSTPITGPPLNLCSTLNKYHKERPSFYGHLIDKECIDRCFKVYPLRTAPDNSETWSIVTLHDLLDRKDGLQPPTSLEDRVRLSLAIASSVLQLSKTPWLPRELTSKNVNFFRRGGGLVSYNHPFLTRNFPENPLDATFSSSPPVKTTPHDDIMSKVLGQMVQTGGNKTIFALGIILLEIILMTTFDQMRESDKEQRSAVVDMPGCDMGIIRDSITAHGLLESKVAMRDPRYKAVVERCLGCKTQKELDEENFRQEVYNDVVMELQAILEDTKIGGYRG